MAVTRIKNNQITDSTITYQKIAPGTLVGSVFNANLNLNSNVSITGNLTVTGNTTTVNSIDTTVNDPLIVFNSGYAGVPSYDVGFLVDRSLGSLGNYGSVNAALVWSESDGAFITVLTTETGATKGSISRTFQANLISGNLTVSNAATIQTAKITNLNVSGVYSASGNIVAGSGAASSSYVTGAIVVPGGGGVGITGALNVQGASGFLGNITAGNIILSGNINVPVGGTFSNTGVFFGNAAGIGALYAGTTGYTPLDHTVFQMTANIDTYAQVNFQNISSNCFASTDFVATADNGSDTDGYINMGINSSTFLDPDNYPQMGINDGYLIHHGVGSTGNLFIINHTSGFNTPTGITFQVGDFGLGAVKGSFYKDGLIISTNTASSSTTTGALIVGGGAGVQGSLYAGSIQNTPIGTATASSGYFTTLNTTNASTGNIVISGGYISALTNAYITTGRIDDFSTANAVISGGYITGVANIATSGVATVSGNLVAASSQSSTSTTTGALIVVGGAGIGGNVNVGEDLYVTGNLTVQGTTTTLNTNVLDVEDKNITIAKGAVNSAAADQGGITLEGANATILYASTGDSWNFNKQVIAPTLNITSNVYLKPQTGGATVAIEPLIIGTIDNMSIGGVSAANVVTTNMRATTSIFATPSGTIWLRGGTGTNGINNIPIGVVTPAAGYFTFANVDTLKVNNTATLTTLSTTTGEIANFSSGNVLIAAGVIYNVDVQANNISMANALITSAAATTLFATNFGTGNAQITGGAISGLSGGTASNTTNSAQTLRVSAGGLGVSGDSYFTNRLGIGQTLTVADVALLNGNILANSQTTTNYTAVAATASTGGALVITGTGGAAVGGNLYVGQGVVINGSQSVHDTIIRGVSERSLIYAVADSAYDQVTIGGNLVAANVTQGAKLTVNSNDSMIVPVGTSAERPSAQGYTDVDGMIRFNNTNNVLEYYGNGQWNNTGSAFTVITARTFDVASGSPYGNVDGINTTFVLAANGTSSGTLVSINGVMQIPSAAYSISGSILTFTEAPAIGDVIDTRVMATTSQVNQLASDNGFNQFVANNTSLSFYTGNVAIGTVENWRMDTNGDFYPITAANIGAPNNRVDYLYASNINLSGGTISGVALTGGPIDDTPIGGNIGNTGNFTTLTANVFQANTSVTIIAGLMTIDNTSNTQVTGGTTGKIQSFDKTVHRSGKFFVQVSDENSGEYQSSEVICVHNGTTATIATYAVTFTGAANLATFSANISGNDVNLNATPVGNVNVKSFATLMKI
jgi:hypothetical protein